MPKPKADMTQRLKNAGHYNKQNFKASNDPSVGIPANKKINKLDEVKAALEKRRSNKK